MLATPAKTFARRDQPKRDGLRKTKQQQFLVASDAALITCEPGGPQHVAHGESSRDPETAEPSG